MRRCRGARRRGFKVTVFEKEPHVGGRNAAILLLWLAIAATLAAFRRVSRAAAWLLAPYLAWVSFAAALNFTLWRLNP